MAAYCTIITGESNEFMREIHAKMPVILPEKHHDASRLAILRVSSQKASDEYEFFQISIPPAGKGQSYTLSEQPLQT